MTDLAKLTLESKWTMYNLVCVPPQIPPEERLRLKMAFMGGATSILTMQDLLISEDVPAEDGGRVIGNWFQEVAEFGVSLIKKGG